MSPPRASLRTFTARPITAPPSCRPWPRRRWPKPLNPRPARRAAVGALPCSASSGGRDLQRRTRDGKASPPKFAKRFLTAGKDEDLQVLRLSGQGVEHPLDPVVVRIHDRLREHPCEGEAYEKRDLFSRSARQSRIVLFMPVADQRSGQNVFGIEPQVGLVPE